MTPERFMRHLLSGALVLTAAACSTPAEYVYVEPAALQEVSAELWRVELTPAAAERTGIETTEVTMEQVAGESRLTIPYSSVIYHYDGSAWTYISPEELVYVRTAIEIDHIEGDTAVLSAGPDVGSTVVRVGSAELYGVEFGIGK